VESTGVMPAATIFKKAVKILVDKCTVLEDEIAKLSQENVQV
jgi:hypothetical protein